MHGGSSHSFWRTLHNNEQLIMLKCDNERPDPMFFGEAALDYLLADGTVSLDLTMSQKTINSVRDHGYLFKIWPQDFSALFPPPLVHQLS